MFKYVESDIFCTKCDDVIDHITVLVDDSGIPDGMTLALLISDSKRIHKKEKGCFGVSWKEGEWKEAKRG